MGRRARTWVRALVCASGLACLYACASTRDTPKADTDATRDAVPGTDSPSEPMSGPAPAGTPPATPQAGGPAGPADSEPANDEPASDDPANDDPANDGPASEPPSGCQCDPDPCPAGSLRSVIDGECCPICVPCPSQCPTLVCGPGEAPYTPPGACCATACARAMVDPGDPATITLGALADCPQSALPACNGNTWPGCALTWEDAKRNFDPGCPPGLGPYLAQCGTHLAIVNVDEYGRRVFLFDPDSERLVGFHHEGADGPVSCQAYDPSFEDLGEACQPLAKGCMPPEPPPMVDPGVTLPWAPGQTPSCDEGQAAYDAYLAAQLDEYNTCQMNGACLSMGGGVLGPSNPCRQRCDLALSVVAINSQILARLDAFGRAACALCAGTDQPECPLVPPSWDRCIDGHCVQQASPMP